MERADIIRITAIVIFVLAIGYGIGFSHGASVVIKQAVKIAAEVGINIDYNMVNDAIFKYNNKIIACIK